MMSQEHLVSPEINTQNQKKKKKTFNTHIDEGMSEGNRSQGKEYPIVQTRVIQTIEISTVVMGQNPKYKISIHESY